MEKGTLSPGERTSIPRDHGPRTHETAAVDYSTLSHCRPRLRLIHRGYDDDAFTARTQP